LITLARAIPGDEDAIASLCAGIDEFYGDTPQGSPGERARAVGEALFGDPPAAHALIARDDEVLAGFASYSFLWPAAGLTTSLYLKELYVAEPYRRSGLGKALMDELYRIAAERGCSRVEWTTDQDNPSAQAFYEALGAKPKTSKIFYRADGETLTGEGGAVSS
jgi:ribosomal protein S18 acetylase RimI-like enzyme